MPTGLEYKKGGRPTKKPDMNEYIMLRSGMTIKEMADHYGVSISTITKWARDYRREYADGDKA